MLKEAKSELVPVVQGFNYSSLDKKTVEEALHRPFQRLGSVTFHVPRLLETGRSKKPRKTTSPRLARTVLHLLPSM